MTDRVPPFALVLAGIASVQFGAALARTMFDDLGAAGTSLIRVFFAALVLMLVFRPDPRRYDLKALRWVLVFGVTLGLMNLTFYLALGRLDLGVAVTIEFIGPLAVAVFGSRRRLDLVWAALAGIGIVLLANPGPGESLDTLGLVYILIAAACWAAYILIAKRAGRLFPGADGVAMAMVIAVLIPLIPGIVEAGTTLLEPQWLALGLRGRHPQLGDPVLTGNRSAPANPGQRVRGTHVDGARRCGACRVRRARSGSGSAGARGDRARRRRQCRRIDRHPT